MQPDREAPETLGAAMEQRRLHLRLRWNQVAERAGMSIAHLSRIRKGEAPPSPLAAASIETALEWPTGTVRRIAHEAGQELDEPRAHPTPVQDIPEIVENPTPREAVMLDLLASVQEEIKALNAKVDALSRDRESDQRDDVSREQKGA
jgi:transcriptional regulator with XRE-family HTH domain